MKKKRKALISVEDRHLWKQVADTITPLSRTRAKELKQEMEALLRGDETGQPRQVQQPQHPKPPTVARSPKPQTYSVPKLKAPAPRILHPIEEPVAKKLAKGRLPIDSRIDLHGMTQDRARFALLDFLQMSQAQGCRIVLVITGKGAQGEGVLRRHVPDWLGLTPFTAYVNGFRISHISHGGEGALYVRLRRPKNRT